LNKIEYASCQPKGLSTAFARASDRQTRINQWLLESFDFEGETVMVAPAAGFYLYSGVGLNQVRIVALKETELKLYKF
jgi:aspartate aminotransferase